MSDEELSRRHRRVSEAAAGAPSGATRAAIRREAERQALARRAGDALPAAANESHWPMRAVAGLAVVGIAAGLWWQMRPRAAPEPVLARIEQPAAAPVPSPMASPATVSAERAEAAVAAAGNAVPAATERPRAPTSHTTPRAASESSVDAKAAVRADSLASEIARRLPSAWHSPVPVDGLWVRLDAEGSVVEAGSRTNELQPMPAAGAPMHELAAADSATAARLEPKSQPAAPAAASEVELLNARGVPLRIHVLREPARP